MLLPTIGLFLSVTFFSIAGAFVLRLIGIRPLRMTLLAVFVLAANAGLLAFSIAYGRIFANAENQLTSAGAVRGFLLGMPVVGVLCGWLAVRWFATRAGNH